MFSTQVYTRGTPSKPLMTKSKPGKYPTILSVSENSKKMLLNMSNNNTKLKFLECVLFKVSS